MNLFLAMCCKGGISIRASSLSLLEQAIETTKSRVCGKSFDARGSELKSCTSRACASHLATARVWVAWLALRQLRVSAVSSCNRFSRGVALIASQTNFGRVRA
eukprot:2465239-Amphidinium_carterae.1